MLTALRIVKITLGATSVVLTLVKTAIDVRHMQKQHRHDMERLQIQREATAAAAATITERIKNGYYDNDGLDPTRVMNDFEFERITYERPS